MLMLHTVRQWLHRKLTPPPVPPAPGQDMLPDGFSASLETNIALFKQLYRESDELLVRRMTVQGCPMAMITLDGLLDKEVISQSVMQPLMAMTETSLTGTQLLQHLQSVVLTTLDVKLHAEIRTALDLMCSGFALLFIEGSDSFLSIGLQGFAIRGISESTNEVTVNGLKEAFIEVLNINITMLRRRMADSDLHFDFATVGTQSRTRVAIVYIDGCAPRGLVDMVKQRLAAAELPMLLDSTFLKSFLVTKPNGFFQPIGKTERPDVLLNKLCEGRVGIMVNGTPFALYVPQLFHENFQTVDDYAYPPFYGFFLRTLKLLTFFVTLILPGLYVAMGTYHPEMFPESMLTLVASSDKATPFSLMVEALLIHIFFEIIREAGIRMPKAIGGAVSIVGALILGDAAVKAGLLTAPMVLLVAITAVGSFIVPGLYEPLSVLRLVFIVAGGVLGVYGVVICIVLTLANITGIYEFGAVYTSPLSPFDVKSQRDTLLRANWTQLGKGTSLPCEMTGNEEPK